MKNRNAMRKTHAETGCVNEALPRQGPFAEKAGPSNNKTGHTLFNIYIFVANCKFDTGKNR
jgi:hypothetical protein